MYNNLAGNYVQDEVMDADPLRLVQLLYQGCVEALANASSCIERHDIAGRSAQITKATAILNELALGLDHTKGGEISRSLAELYDYMARRLNEANFRQEQEPIAEVQKLLATLLEAWETCHPRAQSFRKDHNTTAEYHPISCTA
jgi:flagellar protein FliS